MGAMARYIEALSPNGRDRLIRGQSWCSWNIDDGKGGGCLRGHAEGYASGSSTSQEPQAYKMDEPLVCRRRMTPRLVARYPEGGPWTHFVPIWSVRTCPPMAFNLAYDRWGERVVRAIKQRAARLNGCTPEQIAELLAGEVTV